MRTVRLAAASAFAFAALACSGDDPEPFQPGETTPTATFPGGASGTVRDEVEPNDQVGSAESVSLGDTVKASLSPNDKDRFLLAIPDDFDGYKVTVSAYDRDGTCFTKVDPNLTISTSDGGRVLYFAEDNYAHYCPSISFVAEAGETYLLTVATDYVLTGEYVLTVVRGGPGTISGIATAARLAPTGPATRGEVVEGDVLIAPAPGLSVAALTERLRRRLGEVRAVRPVLGGRYQLFSADPPRALTAAERRQWTLDRVERARGVPGVSGASANGILHPQATPDDPFLDDQWHYGEGPGLNARAAWDLTEGSDEVIVAIIDTGHDADHPDLKGKVAPGGYDFITEKLSALDGDGPDSDPADSLLDGHGSHVAGTVAADTDNGVGVAGVGWETRYLPLRVCGDYGCTEADIAEAIYYAGGYETVAGAGQATARADVINMSLGGHDRCTGPLQDAISAASLRGVVVVVAAGNASLVTEDFSPASCQEVIAVAALNESGNLASFSNYGDGTSVAAPGVNILSTFEQGQYAYLAGTSMASPHVAGVAALLKSVDRSFQPPTIQRLLEETADADFDCTQSKPCGAGLVDAAAAVEAALDTPGDDPRDVVVVTATDVNDASRVVSTLALGGAFTLEGLGAGVWQVDAGIDGDGDRLPDSTAKGGRYLITEDGEDHVGDLVVLP